MPSLEWNIKNWNSEYDWSRGGDEWSDPWGTPAAQWRFVIYPRISSFLPARSCLEIGCGRGRWGDFLLQESDELTLIDVAESCVEACKIRFQDSAQVHCHLSSGSSLDMIENRSLDFAFSFDSLVHAESDVLEGYLSALAEKLSDDGVAFIHHSNLGAYQDYFGPIFDLPFKTKKALEQAGAIEFDHRRSFSVSAEKVQEWSHQSGLSCFSQELITWGGDKFIDCLSLITRTGSQHDREYFQVCNERFFQQAEMIRSISPLYE